MTVVPHPPHFSLFLRFKIKLKGRHFDTTEVIEAESPSENTTSKMHFKNGRSAERDYLEGDGGQ
jgi:hypothetical protein